MVNSIILGSLAILYGGKREIPVSGHIKYGMDG